MFLKLGINLLLIDWLIEIFWQKFQNSDFAGIWNFHHPKLVGTPCRNDDYQDFQACHAMIAYLCSSYEVWLGHAKALSPWFELVSWRSLSSSSSSSSSFSNGGRRRVGGESEAVEEAGVGVVSSRSEAVTGTTPTECDTLVKADVVVVSSDIDIKSPLDGPCVPKITNYSILFIVYPSLMF